MTSERESSEAAVRRTVLLVDDDPTVRQILGRFLGLEGFLVVEAENGQEALAQLRGGCEAAAIVLDLRMPVMDGFAFRRAQREDPSIAAIPVIVLSGADANRFHELAACAAFAKPVRLSDIANQLRVLFGS